MTEVDLSDIKALTFDVFGTVLDLSGSLTPFIDTFAKEKGLGIPAEEFYGQWRARQRIVQFQDTFMMLGHSGYLETVRRALVYALRLNNIDASEGNVAQLMAAWQELSPFPGVRPALDRLGQRYRLVVLSNGDPEFLDHLAQNRIQFEFDDVISVSAFGFFKPHPGVYRGAAKRLGLDVNQCMMISANAFDVVGARASGLRAAFVDRTRLPYDDSPFRPDVTVSDFTELADALL